MKYVSLKRVRLYLNYGCYVIINQTSYTRVLSRVYEYYSDNIFYFSSTPSQTSKKKLLRKCALD